ncbi:immunoglobulin-like domain-containing protein [Anaerotignum sp.]
MKRFFVSFCAAMLTLAGTAYGAEQEVVFFRNGTEIMLEEEAVRKNGKWVVSLADLERLTGSQARDNGDFITFQKTVGLNDTVTLETTRTAFLLPDWTFFDMANGGYRKVELAEDIFQQNETLYLPCREFAAALGYDVGWFKWGGKEVIELKGLDMPEVTLTVEYDQAEDILNGRIENKEPQTFSFGYDFTLEKLTENGWERVKEAEPKGIDDIGFTMNATRSEDGADGMTKINRRVYADLPAGQYRMGIPFSYRYHMKNTYGNPWDKYFENGEADKLGWDFYYSTHWGEPDFYFEGAGLSTYPADKDTHYMLYGEFMVK